MVRAERLASGRWRRTVVSDFERPIGFPGGRLALTRNAGGRPSGIFVTVRSYPPEEVDGAIWSIDPETGAAEPIEATVDEWAIYTDVIARGDCRALACSVIYGRCQRNAGVLGTMGSVEVFGLAGIIPLFGTLYDDLPVDRCVHALAPGATAGEQFLATASGYEDARIERLSGSPLRLELTAELPRGPFDYAPFPVDLARVVQPVALPIPVPEPGSGAAAAVACAALAAGARRRRPALARSRDRLVRVAAAAGPPAR